jgi:hypothetical protein
MTAGARTLIGQVVAGAGLRSDDFALDWIAGRVRAQKGPALLPGACSFGDISFTPNLHSTQLEGLGALKQLVQAAALIGARFDPMLLAVVLEMDKSTLVRHLEELVRTGILSHDQSRRDSIYGFSDALLCQAAYGSIPEDVRRALHAKISRAIASAFPQIAETNPEVVAHHLIAAGNRGHAVPWWRRAAAHAIAMGTPHCAVAHLQRAVLATHPTTPEEHADQIDMLSLLGGQLGQLRGVASPEVVAMYRRALDFGGNAPDEVAKLRFNLLWGLNASHIVRGQLPDALRTGDALLASAVAAQSADRLLLARRRNAVSQFLDGNVVASITLNAAVLAGYDEAHHASLRHVHNSDPAAVAHAYLAWAQAIAGMSSGARMHTRAALRSAGRLNHPYTTAYVLCVLACAAQTLGHAGYAAAFSQACRYLSAYYGFAYWSARADLMLGWHIGTRSPAAGIRAIERAIVKYRQTGSRDALPYGLALLAETALSAGRPDRAKRALTRAQREAEKGGIGLFSAEIARLFAETEAALGAPARIVSGLLVDAVRTAERQGALAFRARAEKSGRRLAPAAAAAAIH